jgi:hypothetical protein
MALEERGCQRLSDAHGERQTPVETNKCKHTSRGCFIRYLVDVYVKSGSLFCHVLVHDAGPVVNKDLPFVAVHFVVVPIRFVAVPDVRINCTCRSHKSHLCLNVYYVKFIGLQFSLASNDRYSR